MSVALKVSNFYRTTLGLCLCLCITGNANAEAEYIIREYPIPEHGVLLLNVPARWNVTYFEPADNPSPIIIFYPSEKPAPFQLTISTLWDDGVERDVTNPAYIKGYLESVGLEVLSYSDQEQLDLIELQGTSGKGYYFQLSDSSAPDDEYKYLTQGALGVGEILLVFSFFSNRQDDEHVQNILEMMRGAIQHLQRHVDFTE